MHTVYIYISTWQTQMVLSYGYRAPIHVRIVLFCFKSIFLWSSTGMCFGLGSKATSKLLSSTHYEIKENCSLKAIAHSTMWGGVGWGQRRKTVYICMYIPSCCPLRSVVGGWDQGDRSTVWCRHTQESWWRSLDRRPPASERGEQRGPAWLGGQRYLEAFYRSRRDPEALFGFLASRVPHKGAGMSLADSALPYPGDVRNNIIMMS